MNRVYSTMQDSPEQAAAGLPNREELCQLLGAAARPSVVATERELSVLRRGLTKAGWKRSLYLQDAPANSPCTSGAGMLSRANYWLAAEVGIPERGGDCHDFFCDDGTQLEAPDQGSVIGARHRCPACGRTYCGEKYDAAYRCMRHEMIASGCLALSLVYQIERDPAYAEKAVKILSEYAAAYPGPHTDMRTGGMMTKSLDEAVWIVPLAQAYDLIYHSRALWAGDKELIESKLFRPVAEGLTKVGGTGSWGAWHLAAVGVVGCAIKDADLLDTALGRFLAQTQDELGDDGLWPGSVHTHHFLALSAFVDLAEACCRLGVDLYNVRAARGRCLRSMFLAPLSYTYPCFQLPAIDDGWYNSSLPLSLYEVAYRRWGDRIFAWALKTGYGFSRHPVNEFQSSHRPQFARNSFYAFVFGRDLPGRVPEPKIASTVFPSVGICALRGDEKTVLTFDYGPLPGPGQLDKMGITFYANDRPLAADYGTPGHGSAILGYYTGTASHNTVMVDCKPQQQTSESSLIAFSPGNYLQLAEAASEEAYPGVKHTRRVALAGDVALLRDTIESCSEHTYDWLLHCEGELVGAPAPTGAARDVPEHFTSPNELAESADFQIGWQDGGCRLAAWFSMDKPGTVVAARCPAETAARTVPVIDLRRRAKRAEYLALLVPCKASAPEIERQGNLYKITRGSVTDWIYVGVAPGTQPCEPGALTTDADLAAVRRVGGKIAAYGLYGGSYITLNGEKLLLGAGRFERVEARLDTRGPIVTVSGATGGYLRLKCQARAMRVNGHRISAAGSDGFATIRLVGVLAGA